MAPVPSPAQIWTKGGGATDRIGLVPSAAANQDLLTFRVNSRAVATFAGVAAAAAFVLVVFLGSAVGVQPGAAAAATPEIELQPLGETTWSGSPADTSLSIGEYGEQVALATLTSSLHEVSNTTVTFFADPDRPGNALQQFAEIFGEAIASGRNPLREESDSGGVR